MEHPMQFEFVDPPEPYTVRDGLLADRVVKVCPVCDRCWEVQYVGRGGTPFTDYYLNFPKYGKKRVPCTECVSKSKK